MRWKVLNPLSATGFLLSDGAGASRDILVDMQGARPTMAESLAACLQQGYSFDVLLPGTGMHAPGTSCDP